MDEVSNEKTLTLLILKMIFLSIEKATLHTPKGLIHSTERNISKPQSYIYFDYYY